MKKSLIILNALFMVASSISHATTVTWSAVPTARTVTLADGLTTLTGGLVLVGNFGNETFGFNPALSISANFTAISTAGAWNQFTLDTATQAVDAGITNTMTITTSPAGKVGGTVTDNNSGATKADFFNSKPVYLWLFNASTVGTSSQMGIFRATTASPVWNFPVNANGVGDSVTLSTTSGGASTMAAIGTLGAVGTASSTQLQLIAVPEPSVLALGGLAGMGMLASRRRKQRK